MARNDESSGGHVEGPTCPGCEAFQRQVDTLSGHISFLLQRERDRVGGELSKEIARLEEEFEAVKVSAE